ncbi:nudix domain-containing protein [Cunninghamella echinulata]|nr:nudix domain-containing protein [Cunninghamella echinulata]
MTVNNVRVGVACIIKHHFEDGLKFLVSQRKGSHGVGHWQIPGGHLEFNESFEQCAKREAYEETNLKVDKCKFITATNDIMVKENKHYVTIFMLASHIENINDLRTTEPDKVQGDWSWVTWKDLTQKSPLFLPLSQFVNATENDPAIQKILGL